MFSSYHPSPSIIEVFAKTGNQLVFQDLRPSSNTRQGIELPSPERYLVSGTFLGYRPDGQSIALKNAANALLVEAQRHVGSPNS